MSFGRKNFCAIFLKFPLDFWTGMVYNFPPRSMDTRSMFVQLHNRDRGAWVKICAVAQKIPWGLTKQMPGAASNRAGTLYHRPRDLSIGNLHKKRVAFLCNSTNFLELYLFYYFNFYIYGNTFFINFYFFKFSPTTEVQSSCYFTLNV